MVGRRPVCTDRLQEGAHLAQRRLSVAVARPVDRHVAGSRRVEAEDQAHGGRLARSVRAQEPGDDARANVEPELVDSPLRPVVLRHPRASIMPATVAPAWANRLVRADEVRLVRSGARALTAQKRIAATASAWAHGDEAVDGHVLVDHVRDAHPVGVEAGRPEADRRDAGQLREGGAVVPWSRRPPSRPGGRCRGRLLHREDDRLGSREISSGITPFGHHSTTGGCSASQSSCGRLAPDPPLDLAADSAPKPLRRPGREIHDGDRQLARRRIGDGPLSCDTIVGRSDGRESRGWSSPARPCHSSRSDRIASITTVAFSIALTAPPSCQAGCADLGVAGPARDADRPPYSEPRQETQASKPVGLGDDARVGADAALDDRRPAGARRLLVGVRSRRAGRRPGSRPARPAPRPRRPSPRSRPSCRRSRGRRACRRAPRRGRARSSTARAGSAETTSMCPLKSSDPPAPAPATRADELRPAREVEARRHERLAAQLLGVGLPEIDLGARACRRAARYSCSAASREAGRRRRARSCRTRSGRRRGPRARPGAADLVRRRAARARSASAQRLEPSRIANGASTRATDLRDDQRRPLADAAARRSRRR